jgi:hypothetical protein
VVDVTGSALRLVTSSGIRGVETPGSATIVSVILK